MQTLDSEFAKMKGALIDTLSKQKNLCITADVWSSRAQSYLGVTVHFINKDYIRESYALAFRQLVGKQTHDVLGKALDGIFNEYGIKKSQITNIVTDGGANFCKMFKVYGELIDAVVITEDEDADLDDADDHYDGDGDGNVGASFNETTFMMDVNGEPFLNEILSFENSESIGTTSDLTNTQNDSFEATSENTNEFDSYFGSPHNVEEKVRIEMPPQRRCVSHLLNRISNDFENKFLAKLPKTGLVQTLNKLRCLWVLTHRSTHAKSTCKQILGKVLEIDCETRWNSRFDAVKMCTDPEIRVNLNKLIQQLKTDLKSTSAQNLQTLNTRDFLVMDDYVTVFEPVAIALDRMQKEFNGSQGYIIPVLFSMKDRITKIKENGPLIKDFKAAMLKAIDHRFKNYFLFGESNKDLLLASITLPRIKTSFIQHDDDLIYTKNMLIAECKNMQKDSMETEITTQSEHIVDDDFIISYANTRDIRRNSIDNEIESEISRFLCDVRTDISILNEYPCVREAYFKFNTTISSSAPVERVFSQSLMIFTPRRNRLSAIHFEQALLLKHNRMLLTQSKRI